MRQASKRDRFGSHFGIHVGPKWDPNGSEKGQAGTKRPQEGTKTLENSKRSDMPKPS